ncbi:hypothetical protein T484DRAFT_1768673 [Baffinella frigidus]|nr:hypothetical protein T484DRAFT_1768673 [Cryptophyta sp. CCMP2293]
MECVLPTPTPGSKWKTVKDENETGPAAAGQSPRGRAASTGGSPAKRAVKDDAPKVLGTVRGGRPMVAESAQDE